MLWPQIRYHRRVALSRLRRWTCRWPYWSSRASLINNVTPQKQPGKARRAAPLFAFAPPLLLLLLIIRYGVDLIDWDQWPVAAIFEKVARGSLSVSDLFAQQAEYRSLFPNLIFLGLGWLTHWNIKCEMFASFLLACLIAFNIYRLARLTVGGDGLRLALLTCVASLLIFGPAQFESWLLGEQIIYFMPAACLTTGLLVAYSELRPPAKFFLCLALSTVSTFSSANGILCWLTLPPVLLFSFRSERRSRCYFFAGLWAAGFALNLVGYLFDYQKPSYTPSLSASFYHPLRALLFFLALIGAPLTTNYRFFLAAVLVGATLTALFAASWLHLVKFGRERATAYRLITWLMLGAYSFLTAAIVTVARVGFGPEQAVASRYTTFSVYLVVSLLFLTAIILEDLESSARLAGHLRPLKRAAALSLAALLFLHLLNSAASVRQMSFMRARRLQAKACLLFINSVPDDCLQRGFPAFDLLSHRANAMNDLRYLRPALIESNRIEDIAGDRAAGAESCGVFETLASIDGKNFEASGWASLPGRNAPADAVLLAYRTDEEQPVIFALAHVRLDDSFFAGWQARPPALRWRWEKSFSSNRFPALPVTLSAWAFDAATGKAYRLDGTHVTER